MDIFVLDSNLSTVGILNNYNSFIWTERYAEAGDFQLDLPASHDNVQLLQQDRFLKIPDSNETMVIENISIKTENKAQYMTVTGRSLISILDRRVVLGTRYFNDEQQSEDPDLKLNIWQIAHALMLENIIDPENYNNLEFADQYLLEYNTLIADKRKIDCICLPNENIYDVDFRELDPNEKIISKKPLNLQFGGNNMYEAIKSICDKYHIGFSISDYSKFPGLSTDKPFVFYFYDGRDLSDSIILSPTFENIANISYSSNKNGYKNIMLAVGDELTGEEDVNFQAWAIVDTEGNAVNNHTKDEHPELIDRIPSGLELRESIQDFTSQITHDGSSQGGSEYIEINDEEYYRQLKVKAYETLSDQNKALDAFDGELVSGNDMYKVKRDYDLGDIIRMSDELGHSKLMRVTEIIYSHGANGYKIYPTLALYEKDEYQQWDES